MTYTFTDDYKTEFERYVNGLYENKKNIDVADKFVIVSELTDDYIAHTGERPSTRQLDRLSTWYLWGVEHDNKEYDVLTDRQMKRRTREQEYPSPYVENQELSLANDGHYKSFPKSVNTDGEEPDQRVKVRLPSSDGDMRAFNRPVRRWKF